MSNELQYDPQTKRNIKDLLFNYLYEPAISQFKSRLEAIISKNCTLNNTESRAFHYKGKQYASEHATFPVKRIRLHSLLHETMNNYVEELNKLNDYELPYVLGFLGQVLNSSDALPDYIGALPEAIHRPLMNLASQCPCKTGKLSQEAILDLKIRNQAPITLIKQRLVMNLLI